MTHEIRRYSNKINRTPSWSTLYLLIAFRAKTTLDHNAYLRSSARFHLPLNRDALNYENIGFSLIWGTEIIALITERSRLSNVYPCKGQSQLLPSGKAIRNGEGEPNWTRISESSTSLTGILAHIDLHLDKKYKECIALILWKCYTWRVLLMFSAAI